MHTEFYTFPSRNSLVADTLCSRFEKKTVSESGATIELYITGITLHIPKGAFEADTIVELGTLDQSTTPMIETDLGEVVLSDIISVGPASVKYTVPAILSIPHSVSEVPKYSSICIIHFDEDVKTWVPLPHPSGTQFFTSLRCYFFTGIIQFCIVCFVEAQHNEIMQYIKSGYWKKVASSEMLSLTEAHASSQSLLISMRPTVVVFVLTGF